MQNIYHASFPGLGLRFVLNPVAFQLGNVKIFWYAIIVCAGFLLALWYVMRNAKRFSIDPGRLLDVVIVGFLCGVVGARLYYVLFFSDNSHIESPLKIFDIHKGGLAIYGGLILGIVGGCVVAKLRKLNVFSVLDIASLGFLIGQSVGRWGNFFNQEAFGTKTDVFCRMLSENTGKVAVHPCFLYESLWCFAGFVVLHIFSCHAYRYKGQLFLLYVVWYGAGRFFIEGLRTDSLMLPHTQLRVSQVLAACSMLVACVLLWVCRKKGRRR